MTKTARVETASTPTTGTILGRMSQTTPTRLWNDSATVAELSAAIGWGAVGATCNPVIAQAALKADAARWRARAGEHARNRPTATEVSVRTRASRST